MKKNFSGFLFATTCLLVFCFFISCHRNEVAVLAPASPAPKNDSILPPQDLLTIVGCGDILLGMNWPDDSPVLPVDDGIHLFDSVRFIIENADIAFGNLEGVLLDTGGIPKPTPPPPTPCYRFRMPERYVAHLLNAGFDVVSVANNHVSDFGPEARQRTIDILDSVGLAHAGSFVQKYCIVERGGIKYGVCAFSANAACVSLLDEVGAQKLIREVKPQCDVLIVSIHAGNEGVNYRHVPFESEYGSPEPIGNVHHFCHACVDAGADIIFGHGPHVARAVELYKDRLIAYSLGNFCTPYGMSLKSSCGVAPLLEVSVARDGSFVKGQIHPIYQQWGKGPRLDPQRRVITEIQELLTEDFPKTPLQIFDDGKIVKKK